MNKKVRDRCSPRTVVMPIGVGAVIAVFTFNVATRAGYPAGLAGGITSVIGFLWLAFLIGRLLDQARP